MNTSPISIKPKNGFVRVENIRYLTPTGKVKALEGMLLERFPEDIIDALDELMFQTLPHTKHPPKCHVNSRVFKRRDFLSLKKLSGLDLDDFLSDFILKTPATKQRYTYNQLRIAALEATLACDEPPLYYVSSNLHLENEKLVQKELKAVERELPFYDLDRIDGELDLFISKRIKKMGISAMRSLSEVVLLGDTSFMYRTLGVPPEQRFFSRDELKLTLCQALLISDTTPLFFRVRKRQVRRSLGRHICNNGVRKWRKQLSKTLNALNINPDDLSDEQLSALLKRINKVLLKSHKYNSRAAESRITPQQIEEIAESTSFLRRKKIDLDEEERVKAFIAVGGSCAPAF